MLPATLVDVSSRSAARAAYAAAGLNGLAALAMLAFLRPGLPTPGSRLADRVAFVAGGHATWWIGWLLWHGAALGLLALLVALAGRWHRRAPIRSGLALLCGAAGLAADLGAQTFSMGLMPGLAGDAFATAEQLSLLFTGYLGNGLYTVAGMLLTWAGLDELPRPLAWLGGAVWCAGLSLSATTLAHSPGGQIWSTAVLMPLFVVWAAALGRWLQSRAS